MTFGEKNVLATESKDSTKEETLIVRANFGTAAKGDNDNSLTTGCSQSGTNKTFG